jgi:hypothetical protein
VLQRSRKSYKASYASFAGRVGAAVLLDEQAARPILVEQMTLHYEHRRDQQEAARRPLNQGAQRDDQFTTGYVTLLALGLPV